MMLGQNESEEQLEIVRAKYGFDKSIGTQYLYYLNDLYLTRSEVDNLCKKHGLLHKYVAVDHELGEIEHEADEFSDWFGYNGEDLSEL